MTPEEMKTAWESTSTRLNNLENNYYQMMQSAREGKKKTALESLITQYKSFSVVALICTVLSVPYAMLPVINERLRLPLAILMAVYFATASLMDYWLYLKMSGIDIFEMGVGRVAELARLYRKRHHQFMMVLIPYAIVMVGFIAYAISDQQAAIYGIIIGAIIGLAIGIRFYLKFMNNYKVLTEE